MNDSTFLDEFNVFLTENPKLVIRETNVSETAVRLYAMFVEWREKSATVAMNLSEIELPSETDANEPSITGTINELKRIDDIRKMLVNVIVAEHPTSQVAMDERTLTASKNERPRHPLLRKWYEERSEYEKNLPPLEYE